MAKVKTPKDSTPKSKSPKKERPTQWYEYKNLHTWRMTPVNEKSLEMLAQQLKEWALKDDSYRITDFYLDIGMSSKTFYEFVAKNENLTQAHEYATRKIASRREIGALTKKLDATVVFRSLPYYCDIDKEMMEYRASLAEKYKKDHQVNEQKIIVVERMPSSPLVLEKKK